MIAFVPLFWSLQHKIKKIPKSVLTLGIGSIILCL
jgi:hypothetical protein